MLGIRELYVKNETTNPSGSFIDRGMTVLVSKAEEGNVKSLHCIPTGNLGASLAAYSARAGLKCTIFLSSKVDLGKLYQMIAYNAEVLLENSFEAVRLKMERRHGESLLVTPVNPFFMEGEKTLGFEVCEQLGWIPPSRIVVPMGTGGLISMVWKGIRELTYIGFVNQGFTKITGVQAEGCSPIVEAFKKGGEEVETFEEAETFATDIRVGEPPLGEAALRAIRDSKGTAIAVSDSEILEATRTLAKTEGVFAEPAAASTVAGLKRLIEVGEVDRDEEIVCLITGAGLKDLYTARRMINDRRRVKMLVYGAERKGLTTKLGDTKMWILSILADRELHGYGIWRSLMSDWSLKISIPSVYQHISELEALGLLRRSEAYVVTGNRRRRYCSLTERGRETLNTLGKIEI
jgi:threonine synthase